MQLHGFDAQTFMDDLQPIAGVVRVSDDPRRGVITQCTASPYQTHNIFAEFQLGVPRRRAPVNDDLLSEFVLAGQPWVGRHESLRKVVGVRRRVW
jgi:hypothetical protein